MSHKILDWNGGDIVSNVITFPSDIDENAQPHRRATSFDKELVYLSKCFGEYLASARGIHSDEEKLIYAIKHEEEIKTFIRQAVSMGLFSKLA